MAEALGTLGQVVKEARRLLQDEVAGPYRYPDADIVDAFNIGLLEARRLRPDLFINERFVTPYYDTTTLDVDGDPIIDMAAKITIEPHYRQSFLYYVVGRLELRDDEQTQDSRASALFNKFINQLLTIAS